VLKRQQDSFTEAAIVSVIGLSEKSVHQAAFCEEKKATNILMMDVKQ